MITSAFNKYGEYKEVFPFITPESIAFNNDALNKADKPKYIFGKEVHADLKLITFGQYSDLCDVFSGEQGFDTIEDVARILFEATDEEITEASVFDLWGLANFAAKEIGSINKLFSEIKMDYTPEEKRAGIDRLQFGTFGILDWYARRMGIHDQNEVNKEKWVRIYQCMKNDMEEALFQRRLQKEYEPKKK